MTNPSQRLIKNHEGIDDVDLVLAFEHAAAVAVAAVVLTAVKCDQIGLVLEGLGDIFFYKNSPNYLPTFGLGTLKNNKC